ncbi:MAG: hypothetical protein K0R38_2000 [Polyangiaceae bacterium]|nr:hypothetical protein [Polyangiaceae bacterium]
MGPRLHSLAGACALVLAASAVRAETSGYRLELVRAEGTGSCPSASALERDVTARLGRDPFSQTADRGIEIVLERDASKWRARLYLRVEESTEDSARVLESEASDCAELGKAVALAVALALAPELPPVPPPAPPEEPTCPPPPSLPPPRSTWHGAVALRGMLSPNLLPRTAGGAALSVTLRGDLLGVQLGGSFYPQQRLEDADARLGFGLSAAILSGCLWPRRTDPQVWSCLGAQLGALHTVVYSPEPSRPGDRVWVAASSELGLRQTLVGRAFVEAGATAVFPFVRHRFALGSPGGDSRVAFDQRGAIVEAFLGFGLRLD